MKNIVLNTSAIIQHFTSHFVGAILRLIRQPLHLLHCTLLNTRCTLLIAHCTLHIVNCTLLIVHCNAQSLDLLIKEAVDNNLELKALESEYLAALQRAPQVSQLPDPEFGVGYFPLPVETRLGAQTARLSATQMFPWFGTLTAKADLENAKAKAVYERIAARSLEVSFEVKQAYFQLYEIHHSQSIILRNIQLLEVLERLALAKVESGKGTAADVLMVQIKIEELKQELQILELGKTNPTVTINQLLNHFLGTPITTVDSLAFAQIPYNKAVLTDSMQANHPMLRMFALQQEASRQAIALNGLDAKPSFGVGLDYTMVKQRTDAEPMANGRDILQLRATVKVPLFRKKYEAKELEENLKIQALDQQKTNLFSKFNAAIEKAYSDYESAKLRTELYQQQKEITQTAINILETDYSTRGNSFDELLQLEKELIDYDLKVLKAVVKSHLALAQIERYLIF